MNNTQIFYLSAGIIAGVLVIACIASLQKNTNVELNALGMLKIKISN